MGAIASHFTSLTIVYSTVYSGTDRRKHQSSTSLAFVRGIHQWRVNSPHKGPVTRKMFPFDDVIMKMPCIFTDGFVQGVIWDLYTGICNDANFAVTGGTRGHANRFTHTFKGYITGTGTYKLMKQSWWILAVDSPHKMPVVRKWFHVLKSLWPCAEIGQELHLGGRFKNTYELLNLRALKFSPVNKIHIFQCMVKIFSVEFQRYPLKFHTKYLTHTLKDMIFILHWNFKSS